MWVIMSLNGREHPIAAASSAKAAAEWVRDFDPSLQIRWPQAGARDHFVARTRGRDWVARYIAQRVPVVTGADTTARDKYDND